MRLQVPAGTLPLRQSAKVGGGSFALHEIGGITVYCRDETGGLVSLVENKPALVASNLRKGPDAAIEAQSFPSLLGTDFFVENRLALYFDPAENVAYLEAKSAS